ncbi:Integral membrane protein CcmA involved in cell shape determination [Polynucleobacter duraquae]|uniref:Integral membrane protein CcmA involved in cell shape determination n=1 Tax=Polynucleobacter duraquae TaxID=1835254 RepID=A0A0E3UZY8_9BURK|nr:polymer-forming cytoskeletal protein [Polynucleobacter duraquae]AKD24819.1 Integral membrane protein CcmA involved in cell shape determination [Polynucleobacter duraquae]
MSIFSKNSTSQNNPEQDMQEQTDNFSQSNAPEELESEPVDQNFRSEMPTRSPINTKPSILSEGFTFEGTIVSDGVLNISGIVRGKVTAKSVLIDSTGQVDGELNTENLVIKGNLKGDVNCDDLNVGPLANVSGNINYKYIHIQRGGKISGKFNKN